MKRVAVGAAASWRRALTRQEDEGTLGRAGGGSVGLGGHGRGPALRCTSTGVHWLCLSRASVKHRNKPGASRALRRRSFQNVCVRPSARGRPLAQPVHRRWGLHAPEASSVFFFSQLSFFLTE